VSEIQSKYVWAKIGGVERWRVAFDERGSGGNGVRGGGGGRREVVCWRLNQIVVMRRGERTVVDEWRNQIMSYMRAREASGVVYVRQR